MSVNFEKASRIKLRMHTSFGVFSVEDLWDLPLKSATKPSVDRVAIEINRKLKELSEESFISDTPPKHTTQLELSMDIIKHVIAVRLEEEKAKAESLENAKRKQTILGIIEQKQNQALQDMPLEELKALVK